MGSEAVAITTTPALIDLQISALSPPHLLQRLFQRLDADLSFRVTLGVLYEHADAPHPLSLLRARDERPRGCRTANKRDELAASHHEEFPARPVGELSWFGLQD